MPREIPNPSSANLRSAAQSVRAAISGINGPFADALTAIAGAFDQAQGAVEKLENANRELASPDTIDQRRRSTAYVSGDRIIGGVSVQGGLKSVAGQSLDLTLEDQVATIAATDHDKGTALPLHIGGSTVVIAGAVSFSTPLAWSAITLQAGWTTAGASYFTPACALGANGLLHLCGGFEAASFVNGSQAGQLASASFYPAKTIAGPIFISDNTAATSNIGEWAITSAGALFFYTSVAANVGHDVSIFIDGFGVRLA